MSGWQIQGNSYSETRDIVIGFDLGTSCTKVLLRDRQLGNVFAVSFFDAMGDGLPYLMPTKFYVTSDGKLSLTDGKFKIDNPKSDFLEDAEKIRFKFQRSGIQLSNKELLAAYIALVLLKVQGWFRQVKQEDYQKVKISWRLNIGLPARTLEDKKLVETIRIVGLSAWNATLNNTEALSLKDIQKSFKRSLIQIKKCQYDENRGELHPEMVEVIPEIIAEVVGYSKSQMRTDGMFFMVDVGARTFDLSTFILREREDEDNYLILLAEVKPYGALSLHNKRMQCLRGIMRNKLDKLNEAIKGTSPLPDICEYYLDCSAEDKNNYQKEDEEIFKSCSRLMAQVIRETKDARNPLGAEWANGIPYFLCGGGSKIEFYQHLRTDVEKRIENTKFSVGLIGKELPKPKNLETPDITPANYYRFAVAYGLCFSINEIGNIIPAKEIENSVLPSPNEYDVDDIFIGKEYV